MDAYIYQAALLCSDCAAVQKEEIVRVHRHTLSEENMLKDDSDMWPQGPYSDGGGEAYCPQHCDYCGLFLENPLTPDGDDYVRDKAREFETRPDMAWSDIADMAAQRGNGVLAEWVIFYFAWGR